MQETGGLLIVALFLGLMIMGLWVFVVVLVTGVALLYFQADFNWTRIGLNMQPVIMDKLTSYDFAALPLFVWMAEILFRARLSEKIFSGLAPWLGSLPGRLLHVNVFGCGLFAAVCGSSAATCATIARITLDRKSTR